MPYGVRVYYNSEDISDKVRSFAIMKDIQQHCDEVNIDIVDPDFYDALDFSQLPEAPLLEIWTRTGASWVSQGQFYIERPSINTDLMATTSSFWGRSTTARLAVPFAPKVSKVWNDDTMFYDICEEMCDLCGITWDDSYSEVPDFKIYAQSLEANQNDPIEVLSELLQVVYEDSAYITTDSDGHVCIKLRQLTPTSPTETVTDPVAISISEEPEWPEFGNRIKIIATGSAGGYSVTMSASNTCLSNSGMSKLFARVADQDGNPVQNVPVTWELEEDLVALLATTSTTQTITVYDEEQRSKSFYTVDLAFPPSSLVSIYKAKDISQTTNLTSGCTISGNTVTFPNALDFCNQALIITYRTGGVAVNYATAGTTPGTEKVTASVAGNYATVDLYVENPCNCSPTVSLRAFPSSITIGAYSDLLVYAEIGGAPMPSGRAVYMTLASSPAHGSISWTKALLGTVTVQNEVVDVVNEINGISQCNLPMWPSSVTGVWLATFDEDGNPEKSGSSIYGSNDGKTVTLTVDLETGTQLIVDYKVVGAAMNEFKGVTAGTDKIKAFVVTSREEPAEAFCTVNVNTTSQGTDDPDEPPGCCDDGLCETDSTPCTATDTEPCEDGKVRCKRSGVEGCFNPDACGNSSCLELMEEDKIECYKDGEWGCYLPEECDTSYIPAGGGPKYGYKNGVLGCWPVDELDVCGGSVAEPLVKCHKGGALDCVAPGECDDSYGGGEAKTCEGSTQCCEHKTTGAKGCWKSTECKEGTGGGGGSGGTDPKTLDPSGDESCTTDTGKTKCKKGEKCCNHKTTGKRGCHPQAECEDSGWGCAAKDCSQDPSEECLQARFGLSLSLECTCDEICETEFNRYGTTQKYDGSSYKPITEMLEEEGLTEGTEDYNARFEELKQEAISECIEQCGGCAAYGELTLSGPTEATAPGSYQYSCNSQMTPLEWEVVGEGASIEDGLVTLTAGACGTFTVTVTDVCGKTGSIEARVTNRGSWVSGGAVMCPGLSCSGGYCDQNGWPPTWDCAGYMALTTQYVGAKKYTLIWSSACCYRPARCSNPGSCVAGVTTFVTNNDDGSCWSWCNIGPTYIWARQVNVYNWSC